ncbi:MAG: hypothetical protein O3B01_17820 [Planctomycetota bacterium]|nr:hypothetical protein [Planctomycetota bacterium]MDA1140433.1 hypothetical protein [Planctomycetota bacterium]
MNTVKKLILPSVLLLLFLIPSLYQDELSLEIQAEFFLQILNVARYVIGSCLWLTAGWLVIRILNLVVWPILIEKRLG